MSLGSLVALLLALAKAAPLGLRLADEFSAKWTEHRRTATHARIDQAIAAAQRTPWECPAACPHRLSHLAGLGGPPAGSP